MIRLTDDGKFKIVETEHGTKVLELGDLAYAWVMAPGIGSLLIYSENQDHTVDILSEGNFKIYEVSHEADLASPLHLELQIDDHAWQGYLLLSGLPDRLDTRKRMLPTEEIITNNSLFSRPRVERSHRPLEGAV